MATWFSAAQANSQSFPLPQENFDQYISEVLDYLRDNSFSHRSVEQVLFNLPFQLKADNNVAYRGKFLLIHGLNDSAYVWSDMGKTLSAKGFDVRAILLPGHGSHPDKMLEVSFEEWLDAARLHYQNWNSDGSLLYLGGFSLGGVIATILALENQDTAGLLLFSPAYESKLNSWLRWSWIYSKFKPYMFGGLIIEDNPVKYNSIAINSATQYYKTTKYLKRHWGNRHLSMPVLMIVSEQDSVVNIDYTREIFQKRFTHKQKTLVIYSDQDLSASKHEIVVPSEHQELRILSQSHLSLMNSPENNLFGVSRKVLVCNGNEYPLFMSCMNSRRHWYGAQHTVSPDGIAVARATYNPDYERIENFIEQLFFSAH